MNDDFLEIEDDEQDACDDEDECDEVPLVTTRASGQNKLKQGIRGVGRSRASAQKVSTKVSKIKVRRAAQLGTEEAMDEEEEESTQVMADEFEE